ncbi:MAG: hypothetical protein RL328_2525 [Acidobacteriota bacterium]|jgi:FKBP-type peptidyl-prolyl cis-trans isomerase FkpA
MRRFLAATSVSLLLLMAGCNKQSAEGPNEDTAKAAGLNTDEEKTIYAVGLLMGRQLSALSLSPAELEIVKHALSDAANNKPAVNLDEWGPKIDGMVQVRQVKLAGKTKEDGKAYQEKAAAESGAKRTQTGLVYKELTAGSGAQPTAQSTVKVNYKGALTNGTEFDSSYKRGQPAEFPLSGVIPCWTEGVQMMKVGGKAQLVCPSEIAYGDGGRPPTIPGGATLVFEVELLEVK